MSNIPLLQVVVGVITRDDQVLLSLRPEGKPYAGYWEFPGGKIHAGESELEALTRELEEELGIKVTSASSLFEHKHTYVDRKVLLSIWQVDAFSGDPKGLENQQLQWFGWHEITNLRLLAANYAIIDKAKLLLFPQSL